MDSLLIDEWLDREDRIDVVDEASAVVVRDRVREVGAAEGLPAPATARLVNAASELVHNQLAHARRGVVAVRPIARAGSRGVEVIAADEGNGIESPSVAFRGVPNVPQSSDERRSLGVGLAATLELSDEVDVDVRIGEGTCIWARKFAEPPPRRRQVGIYGRPYPGERTSGDHAGFLWRDGELVIGVADGLGHGEPARIASNLAIASLRQHAEQSLDDTLKDAHRELEETRGAVVAFAKLIDDAAIVEAACVGNVAFHLYSQNAWKTASGVAYVLGVARGSRRPATERFPLGTRDTVVLFTDGLYSRATLEGDLALMREHPIIIAHQLVERFARDNDDCLVLVVS